MRKSLRDSGVDQKSRLRIGAAVIAAAALTCASRAVADTITIPSPAEDPQTNTIGNGATLGIAGYVLLEVSNANATNLPNWASVTPGSAPTVEPYASGTFSTITAISSSDTTYTGQTAMYYSNTTTGVTLATITLSGSNIPSEFQIGLLTDNNTNANRNADFIVSDSNGATPTETTDTTTLGNLNDFYLLDITGAVSGETITIVGEGNSKGENGGPELGGITFDSLGSSVPEPAALSLLAGGCLGLLTRRRRRSLNLCNTN